MQQSEVCLSPTLTKAGPGHKHKPESPSWMRREEAREKDSFKHFSGIHFLFYELSRDQYKTSPQDHREKTTEAAVWASQQAGRSLQP